MTHLGSTAPPAAPPESNPAGQLTAQVRREEPRPDPTSAPRLGLQSTMKEFERRNKVLRARNARLGAYLRKKGLLPPEGE